MPNWNLAALIALALLVCAGSARAQLPLPDVSGTMGNVTGTVNRATPDAGDTARRLERNAAGDLRRLRQVRIDALIQAHRDVIDVDGDGAPIIRSEIVVIDPSENALASAQAQGFLIGETIGADALGLNVVVLRAPQSMSTRRALETLRRGDPNGSYDYNHLYLGADAQISQPALVTTLDPPAAGGGSARIGLVDSGVDGRHPAFAGIALQQRGFAGEARADAHGTAVASLIARAAPGVRISVADVYGGRPTGGGASAIIAALGWLAQSGASVINVSLVGPPNRALEAAVRALIQRGHVVVAAVGNDGPSAPPLYPAAYPGVVGVTGVDARNRALPEAGRGAQVDFAAPGAEIAAASAGGGYANVRGTSYAAPIVAALLARSLGGADPGAAARAQTNLAAHAADLGARGRDQTFGAGLVGADMRNASSTLVRR